MKEISNKTLTILLIVAIAVALGGTFTSLSMLSRIKAPVTGLATSGTGKVNLSITSATSIVVSGNIDFGSGYMSDPRTAEFLANNCDNYPEIFRHSWYPCKKIAESKQQKKLNGF